MSGVRRFAPCSLLAFSLVVAAALPARAQITPRAGTPPCYPDCPVDVIVFPGTGTVYTSTLAVEVNFCSDALLYSSSRLIKLRRTDVTDDFTYTTTSSGECTGTYRKLSEDTITLTSGTNAFYAKICNIYDDCDSQQVTYTYTINEVAPTIELVNHNGDHRDRSMCLTAGAGEAAAYQCGDLMVAHSLPGYRTKGRDRALTLVYNSSQAEPRPAVAVNVTNSSGISPPDSIAAELIIDSITVASATYAKWIGGTRQIVLAFDGSSLSSGLYPFTLNVHNVYSSGPETATISDTLIVVNRSAGEFGRGWSVAGVEQLVTGQGVDDILWIGGDGSAKRYRKIATGRPAGTETR